MNVIFTEAARQNIKDIGDHIAENNPERALAFVSELIISCQAIAGLPNAWPLVPRYELFGVRRKVHATYLIFYRVSNDAVEVLNIMHNSRDYELHLFPGGD